MYLFVIIFIKIIPFSRILFSGLVLLSFCLPVIEAAAYGCYVISTPVGISASLLRNNRGGTLCEKKDIVIAEMVGHFGYVQAAFQQITRGAMDALFNQPGAW